MPKVAAITGVGAGVGRATADEWYPSGVGRGQAPPPLISSSASGLPGSKVMETERARMKPSRP